MARGEDLSERVFVSRVRWQELQSDRSLNCGWFSRNSDCRNLYLDLRNKKVRNRVNERCNRTVCCKYDRILLWCGGIVMWGRDMASASRERYIPECSTFIARAWVHLSLRLITFILCSKHFYPDAIRFF